MNLKDILVIIVLLCSSPIMTMEKDTKNEKRVSFAHSCLSREDSSQLDLSKLNIDQDSLNTYITNFDMQKNTALNLSYNNFKTFSIADISLPYLRILNLSHCAIDSLCNDAFKGTPQLRHLLLQHNNLDDNCVAVLAQVTSLETLMLDHNKKIKKVVNFLTQLPKLVMLGLEGTSVDTEIKQRMRVALKTHTPIQPPQILCSDLLQLGITTSDAVTIQAKSAPAPINAISPIKTTLIGQSAGATAKAASLLIQRRKIDTLKKDE